MARDFFINGPTDVLVKGRADSAIANLTDLGLSDSQIRVRPQFKHSGITVNSWGQEAPEYQWMLGHLELVISLVNFDRTVLDVCLQEAMGGVNVIGTMAG